MPSDVKCRKKKITVTLTITSVLASSQGFQSLSNWRVLVWQAGNSGLQFSSCQTISQTRCMMEGYRISIRHWPLCYFLPASIKRFPFKLGFCRFPWFCVFRSPGEEAGIQTEIQSTLSFGIHILHGRWLTGGAFEHTAPVGALLSAKYFWRCLCRTRSTAGCAPPPLLHRQLSLWNGKGIGLLSEGLHLAPAVDIFKVNI